MHWPKSNAPLAEPDGAKIDSEQGATQFDDSENILLWTIEGAAEWSLTGLAPPVGVSGGAS